MVAVVVSLVVAASDGAGSSGADPAFYPVFAVFILAFAVLAVVTVRWALRRDRARRAEWLRHHQQRMGGDIVRPPFGRSQPVPPPQTNGHGPRRPGQKGRERKQPG